MVDVPDDAYGVNLVQGTIQIKWNPGAPNLYLQLYATDLANVVTLQPSQSTYSFYCSDNGRTGIEVWEQGAASQLEAATVTTGTTEWQIIYGTSATVTITLTPGTPVLTVMRFIFHYGTGKPSNMAIEVYVAPANNKDDWLFGYRELRSFINTGSPTNDPMNQPMKAHPGGQDTTVDMAMSRPVTTPDDLNGIVRITVDPQSGGYFDRADAISFRWGVVPQWNNAWGGEISAGDWLTMGREADQPSYYEHPAYIDPSTAHS